MEDALGWGRSTRSSTITGCTTSPITFAPRRFKCQLVALPPLRSPSYPPPAPLSLCARFAAVVLGLELRCVPLPG